MKQTRLFEFIFTYLPLLSLIAAFGIVFHQYNRRDNLKQQLADAEREYSRYIKRYQELRHRELADATVRQSKVASGPATR